MARRFDTLDLRSRLENGCGLIRFGTFGGDVSQGTFFPLSLSLASEAFDGQILWPNFLFATWHIPHQWFRCYVHVVLRASDTFPGLVLSDESLDHRSGIFADTWKGVYNGNTVCIKAIRTWHMAPMRTIERVNYSFVYSKLNSAHTPHRFTAGTIHIEIYSPSSRPRVIWFHFAS